MLNVCEFISIYNGRTGIGNTPENKGQCVGLVSMWEANLGLDHIWGNAKDLFDNASKKQWTKTKNAPSKYPVSGDILVFNKNAGGGAGHTGLVIGSNSQLDSVTIFEQNNPGNVPGVACEVNTYKGDSWKLITGWLHPIKSLDECKEKYNVLSEILKNIKALLANI